MFKRTWIVILSVLVLGLLVSACGGGDLAEDLTPIPTLPPGEEPALLDALQAAPEATQPPDEDGEAEMSQEELVALGEQAFGQCVSCHGAEPGAGPALPGMAERAATRIEGMSAEDYLRESIVEPGAYIVEGYSDIMPANYDETLTEQEIEGLVAYIMAESGADEPAGEETPTAEPTETPTEEPADDEDAETAGVEGDPAAGEPLFVQNCASCHGEEDGVGPALPGMAERAAERVEGMSAEDYLHESIVDPGAYVVEGYQNIMPPGYGDQFSEQELQDIIAYMMDH